MINTYELNKGENYDADGRNLKYFLLNNCYYANSITLEDNNVPTITSLSYMFSPYTEDGEAPSDPEPFSWIKDITFVNFNTSLVINASYMFAGCKNLVNITDFNTSNITDMSYMFNSCGSLINIPNLDTSNVINISGIFLGCYRLSVAPNLDTSKVTNMCSMFNGCWNLTSIPNYDTSKVSGMWDMYGMFYGCRNLITAPNFDIGNATTVANMFYNCRNLTTVPQYDMSSVINAINMFCRCNNLTDASLQNIINSCLNSRITNSQRKTLRTSDTYSLFYNTNISSSRYENRWSELTAAGWTY